MEKIYVTAHLSVSCFCYFLDYQYLIVSFNFVVQLKG